MGANMVGNNHTLIQKFCNRIPGALCFPVLKFCIKGPGTLASPMLKFCIRIPGTVPVHTLRLIKNPSRESVRRVDKCIHVFRNENSLNLQPSLKNRKGAGIAASA